MKYEVLCDIAVIGISWSDIPRELKLISLCEMLMFERSVTNGLPAVLVTGGKRQTEKDEISCFHEVLPERHVPYIRFIKNLDKTFPKTCNEHLGAQIWIHFALKSIRILSFAERLQTE